MHPGQRIGKYVLGEKIAVGGMAEVWAARAEGPEGFIKPVALKFILESFSGDPELERLFVKEARIAAQLQHANLVAVFDFDKVVTDPEHGQGGRYYIAMEHVEGHDARRVVEAAKHAGYVFPLPLALYLAGEVLKGLRYVHERRENGRPLGLVHRDVSPHNVLVGFSGEVKLSDFGIAKSLAHSSRTKTGTIRGKLSYASPEQLNGEPVDQRTDQFAMGITLWEILAGRPLFDGNDEIEIVGKVMRCDVPPLTLVCPDRKVPPALEAFVRKMLSLRPHQRFATTTDALSALLALPAYSADGAPLGELVSTLFHRASLGPASKTSLPDDRRAPAPAAKPGARREPLSPLRRNPRAGGSAARAGGAGEETPPPSEVETRTMARSPARSSAPGALGRWGAAAPTAGKARAAWGRSWPVVAAAVAVVAVAVGVAVLVSVGGRGRGQGPATASAAEPEGARPAPGVPPSSQDPSPEVARPAVAAGGPAQAGLPPPAVARLPAEAVEKAAAARRPPSPPADPPPVRAALIVAPPAAAGDHAPAVSPPPPAAVPNGEPATPAFETAAITVRAAPPAPARDGAATNGAPIVE